MSEKHTVRFFVSYAHKDKRLLTRLMEKLEVRLKADPDIHYQLWDDTEISLGARWFEAIGEALKACDFGLLMVSYPFLTSEFIQDHELPSLLRGERALPVGLSKVALDGSADLRGLEAVQIFLDEDGKFFSQHDEKTSAEDDFAETLFQRIRKAVKKRIAERSVVVHGARGRSPDDRPLQPDSPFLDTIEKKVRGELERESLSGLAERLRGEEEGASPGSAAAVRLVRELSEVRAVHILSDAVRELLPSMRELEREQVAVGVRTLLGWLLLRCVSEGWLEHHQREFDGGTLRLELSLKTHIGVELVLARIGEYPATLRTGPTLPEVYGGGCISQAIPESGIEPGFGVEELKGTVWRAVFNGAPPPRPFDEELNEELDAELAELFRVGEPYYFTIPPGGDLDTQRKLFRQLLTDLPNLPVIFIGTGEGEALLVSEYAIRSPVRQLLLFLDDAQDQKES